MDDGAPTTSCIATPWTRNQAGLLDDAVMDDAARDPLDAVAMDNTARDPLDVVAMDDGSRLKSFDHI
nr:unnamed protein product [Digitaria exilis]